MKMYVGNLAFNTTEAELRSAFAAHGEVASCRLVNDRDTGQPRGFGFVEMNNDAEANTAMQALDGKDLGGRALKVNEAKPQTNSGGGYGGGRSGGGGNRW